jgi:hypothetical protein
VAYRLRIGEVKLSPSYHVPDMKQFLYDPNLIDPVDVARRDHMEYLTVSVIQFMDSVRD